MRDGPVCQDIRERHAAEAVGLRVQAAHGDGAPAPRLLPRHAQGLPPVRVEGQQGRPGHRQDGRHQPAGQRPAVGRRPAPRDDRQGAGRVQVPDIAQAVGRRVVAGQVHPGRRRGQGDPVQVR